MTPSNQSLALIKWSKLGVIYAARNRVNGHLYIGQSVNFRDRKRSHFRDAERGSELVFHLAIRKYGVNAFDWLVLQSCNDRETLDEAEIFWIRSLNTMVPNGYNMSSGGCGTPDLPPEIRERITKSMTGRKLSAEHIKKMSDALRGRRRADWEREKISAAKKGKPYLEARGPNHALYGTHRSEETKRKLSEATKKSMTPERLEEMRIFKTGWKHSEETLRKMSETRKSITPRGPDHPWYGKKQSEDQKRKVAETKRKNRELRGNEKQIGLDFDHGGFKL